MIDRKRLSDIPFWLREPAASLAAGQERKRNPQALLIHGIPGSGRRVLALWYAAHLLGIPHDRLAHFSTLDAGALEQGAMGHADFMFLQPPPEKSVIPVEAVRELIGFLQLKSHQGGARVALVCPADSLTTAAANSLLKTLEEPPAGGFIILVASSPAVLPATILSRCQRLAVRRPVRQNQSCLPPPQSGPPCSTPAATWRSAAGRPAQRRHPAPGCAAALPG